MNVQIKQIEYYLPEHIITNEYLAETCGIDKEFLENKIGIKERHIAAANETSSEMAYKAGIKIFENSLVSKEQIDLLIVCTQNPDYKLPTTACILQDKLGLKKNCIAFDINLGCSGFIYSLIIAGNFIKTGIAKRALIVMVDQYSKLIDYTDKNTASLFGDAATASLLEDCAEGNGILDFDLGTDGSGAMNLIAYNSGVASNPDQPQNRLYMNGREIFKFSISVVPDSVNKLLSRNNLKVEDIKYFVFHQANQYMLGEIRKKLNLTKEQLVIDMELYGNTVSSSIPIALKNLISKSLLKSGDIIVLSGFGVGLSWGTILYKVN
jgi:3-oxoacyl-[acyl-carrier-protein] synthase III